jgi:hypothetical protein
MTLAYDVAVADQVWIAVALLHRAHPERESFRVQEVIDRVRTEFGEVREGIPVHVSHHAVANVKPSSGRHRFLFRPQRGRVRLYRPDDACHPDRERGGKFPRKSDLPERYRPLVYWYEHKYVKPRQGLGPLLALLGAGRSGKSDLSERHDEYLIEALLSETTPRPSGKKRGTGNHDVG